jgi:hypothetical protein
MEWDREMNIIGFVDLIEADVRGYVKNWFDPLQAKKSKPGNFLMIERGPDRKR